MKVLGACIVYGGVVYSLPSLLPSFPPPSLLCVVRAACVLLVRLGLLERPDAIVRVFPMCMCPMCPEVMFVP